jgi:hypothetical protein
MPFWVPMMQIVLARQAKLMLRNKQFIIAHVFQVCHHM